MTPSAIGRERRLDAGWGELAVLEMGDPGGQRLLCLHGWMDNAASFRPLAGALPEFHWVSLDFAGHGASDHRPAGARYYMTDYVFDLDAVLDALGWETCTLVGHSMGAAVAACYACADPTRVTRLAMLDGLGGGTEDPDKAGERLIRSLRSVREPRDHRSVFDSPELAARARRTRRPLAEHSALLLAERALAPCDGGWRWRTDARAMWDSPLWMTEAQSQAILGGIQCPSFVAITPSLVGWLGERVESRLERLRTRATVDVLRVEGDHHVHMDQPERVAGPLRDFLNQEDPNHD